MPSKATYRRRRLFAACILVAAISLIWWGLSSFTSGNTPDDRQQSTVTAETIELTESPLTITLPTQGTSAIGVSGLGVIAQNSGDTVVPIASIAKTITALVVLQKLAPEPNQAKEVQITFDEVDEQIRQETIAQNGASQPVFDGLTMTLYDALATTMLASANNYATSLAIHAFGSLDEFILQSNSWLKQNGLNNTKLADASGLSPGTVGTANDLVSLGFIAMENQDIAEIVGTPSIEVSGLGTIQNGNPMFGIDGVDGIKLGSTFEANNCLLYSKNVDVEGNTVRVVGVTLGLDEFSTIIEEASISLDEVSYGLQYKELISKNAQIGKVANADGSEFEIVTSESLSSVIWPGISVIVKPEIKQINDPQHGSEAGIISVKIGVSYYEVPLVLK